MATDSDNDNNKNKNKEASVLKDKLRELVKVIVEGDGDDHTVLHAANDAITTLSALKNLQSDDAVSSHELGGDDHVPSVPPQFLCPISGHLMADPVILANGKTYDRSFIQKWLNEVHRTCRETRQVLSHSILAPNSLVKDLILQWCKEQGIEPPKPIREDTKEGKEAQTDAHINRLNSLLHNLTLSVSDQKEAAKELRQLTKQIPATRTLFKDLDSIKQLLCPLSAGTALVDPQLHEDLITTVFNLSIPKENKRLLAEDETVISLLIDSLRTGTIQTRNNAASAILSLSSLERNKGIIGESGAIKYLVDILENGPPSALRDAGSAIFKLCTEHENQERTVREGAVQVMLHKIRDNVMVDEFLGTLELLSNHRKAVDALCSHGAVPFLLSKIRESELELVKEKCAVILYTICFSDRTKLEEIGDDQIANGTLSELAKCGTSRARRKAIAILEKLDIPTLLKHI